MPLLRFADAYPVSEFRLRSDLALYGLPGEQLLPFEGAAFTTTWTLELPQAVNPAGLHRVIDVRITFDLQAAYEVPAGVAAAPPQPSSRSMFVSALALIPLAWPLCAMPPSQRPSSDSTLTSSPCRPVR